uniref:Uncharacterized protein n=1 Tax=Anguilla anguilla TaxID=7936 RepID=A0A0E9SP19_ANGAN
MNLMFYDQLETLIICNRVSTLFILFLVSAFTALVPLMLLLAVRD